MDDISMAAKFLLGQEVNELNILQLYLNSLVQFVLENGMKINFSKSKMMKFTRSDKEFSQKVSIIEINY